MLSNTARPLHDSIYISLTFGANPEGGRHAFEDRWPTELGRVLGDDKVRIIAEGLGGRTTVFDDLAAAADRNGANLLPSMLASHSPLDCVVIMLGTNDMKDYLCGSALGTAAGMKRLVEMVLTYPYGDDQNVPQIVVVSPPHCVATTHADLNEMFTRGLTESPKLAAHYARHAGEMGVEFFDSASVAVASALDGVHLDAANTRAIGAALAPIVGKALGL